MDKYNTNFRIKNKTFCFILLSVITFNFITIKLHTLNVIYNHCINIQNYIFNNSLRVRTKRNKLRRLRRSNLSFNLCFFPISTILFTFFSLLVKKKYGSQTLCESMCERGQIESH